MNAPAGFTTRPLQWKPFVAPVDLDAASAEQLNAMQVTPSNRRLSDYVRVLAHDPETLSHRTPLFNAIMYGRDGLSRAERELGAVGASIVNRCVYCGSIHGARFTQLSRRPEVVDRIFADGLDASLEPRDQAVFDFAVNLTRAPPVASAGDVEALRSAGLTELEIVDLILSVAIFNWANRLMHTLGEPVEASLESDSAPRPTVLDTRIDS